MLIAMLLVLPLTSPALGRLSNGNGEFASLSQTYAKESPFEMIRWNGESPEVSIDGTWCRLEAIDGVSRDTLLAEARRLYGQDWARRFCDDLVELMTMIGHAPGSTTDVLVANIETAKLTTLRKVRWSSENRRRIRDAKPRPGDNPSRADDVPRIERERLTEPAGEFAAWARRIDALESSRPRISRSEALRDLAQLEWLIEHTYSYRHRAEFDTRAAFDTLHASMPESISCANFALQVHRLLCAFGDGHSRVRVSTDELFVSGVLPFVLARDAHGVLALADGGESAFDPRHPYLAAIDGEAISVWLAATKAIVPRGSEAFEDRQTLRRVVHVAHLRAERGLAARSKVIVRLVDRNGRHVDRDIELEPTPARARERELLTSRRLDGDIGYLRIGSMDDDDAFLAQLRQRIDELSGVRGLVIDVRGNGGGSRRPLLVLAPRLMPDKLDALVVNVAALRVAPGDDPRADEVGLADRFLYPEDWGGWSPNARAAVRELAATFEPQTPLPRGAFSRWHFLVLEREPERAPMTRGRVAVLVDEGCFSATDIFLGALAQMPNVRLFGAPSGGGSGRARRHTLVHSNLDVQLSTMASFLPNGAEYDGRGIEPHERVQPTLDDFLGRTDTTLELACKFVRRP